MLLSNDSPLFKALEEQIKNIGTIKEPEVIKEPNQPNAVELKETYLWLTKWDSNIGHLKGYRVAANDFMGFAGRASIPSSSMVTLNSALEDNKDKVIYIENLPSRIIGICVNYLDNPENILSEAIVHGSNLTTKITVDADLVDIQDMGKPAKKQSNTGCWILYHNFNEEGSAELLYRVDKTGLIRRIKREVNDWPRSTYTDRLNSLITLLLGVEDPFINTFSPMINPALMEVIGEFAIDQCDEVTLIDPDSVPTGAVSDTKDIEFTRNLKFLAIPAPIPESYDPDYDYDTKHKILKVGTKHEDRESY